ncbi:MAG: hypothetical protein ACOYIF_06730 [Acetivibrionales bacterium]|jgi:hypothetical protein
MAEGSDISEQPSLINQHVLFAPAGHPERSKGLYSGIYRMKAFFETAPKVQKNESKT